ncbi:MAG: hypothetical protein Tsb009_07190 [Planctomycetaceae bacterium]
MARNLVQFGASIPESLLQDDSAFLQAIAWNRGTPAALIAAAQAGDVREYRRRLKKRNCLLNDVENLKSLFSSLQRQPALWSRDAFEATPQTDELLQLRQAFLSKADKHSGKKKIKTARKTKPYSQEALIALEDWLDALGVEESATPSSPLEILLINELLVSVGRKLPGELRWRLWKRACVAAIQHSTFSSEIESAAWKDDQRAVLLGEIPFQAGLLFADIKGSAKIRKSGANELSRILLESTDTDGTPHAEKMERLPFWLAPFVRTRQWAKAFGEKLFSSEAEERFQDTIRIVMPMCRMDGQFALGNGFAVPVVSLLESATLSAGFKRMSPPRRFLDALEQHIGFPGRSRASTKGKRPQSSRSARKMTDADPPVTQSDWAQLACLRSNWSLDADAIIVAHNECLPRIEMSALGFPLFSGHWELQVSIDDHALTWDDSWTCSCWFSDDDVDFIELHHDHEAGVMVDRQILLSRNDNFAIFADCLRGPEEAVIEYRQGLPLMESVTVEADVPTRECRLKRKGLQVRAFPVGLPDDRIQSTPGFFGPEKGRLELCQTAKGGLYAPVVLDWSPRRKRSFADWRTLTIAEDGRRLSSAEAMGHRIRIGNHQLLVYRAFTKSHLARSILGQHTRHETVIGLFGKNGKVDPLLLVE